MTKKRWLGAIVASGMIYSATTQGSVAVPRPERPVKAREWTTEAKLWTARSCVGEAGFDAQEECMAIAWVYATRARASGKPYLWIVKRYSAAVKKHEAHRRPWIRQLNLRGEKPKDWPRLNWKMHRYMWKQLLSRLDRWARGHEPNPVEGANHYGSQGDAKRAHFVRRWRRLDTPEGFQNWFFDSTNKARSEKLKEYSETDFNKFWKQDYKLPKGQGFGIIYSGRQ